MARAIDTLDKESIAVPDGLLRLVERFDRYRDAYRSGTYKEAQVRQEFIDPLLSLLDWDVDNAHGLSPTYREVVHEDAILLGGGTKAPDYSLRIGGERKFFVEAKKPSVNVRDDVAPAFQLRRYAWSAKLPLSVLTDFEEFAVYDTCVRPDKDDSPTKARLKYMRYTEYPERWGEIVSIFSKQAVLSGSLEEHACKTVGRRGTDTVNAAFLREIESWREALARNLALRNPHLTQRQLNYAVQMTIDRIIFLRMAEDRGIEEYGRLQTLLKRSGVYDALKEQFVRADERYNSGLFHFQSEKGRPYPDDLTPSLNIDDKVLKAVVKRLYYPDSPYEFSVLPIDVLGQVYEQFLGKVIRLSPSRKVVVEEKPEVRKAGGVYYTPTYIVDYIVKHTVGKLLEGRKAGPRGSASKLRIVDPACGSGSFLIGAYSFLLDWHRDQYVEDGPEKHSRELYQGPGGTWHLTTQEKKRILLNNIYGVDIDSQAVEVTKLSLLLKVLEGESEQSLVTQLSMFHERALPDLDDNIKCGNSLIGPDFYDNVQSTFLDEDEQYRINVFDWRSSFPQVFSGDNPGFDAVIGNPPYLRIQGLQEYYGNQVAYFMKHYQSAVKRFDLYLLFTEKGFDLLRLGGRLGFICPHKFLNSDFGSGLRQILIQYSALDSFVSFGNNLVFNQASTYTGILLLERGGDPFFGYYQFPTMPEVQLPMHLPTVASSLATYDLRTLSKAPWVLTRNRAKAVLERLSQQPLILGQVFEQVMVGIQSGIDNIHILRVRGKSDNGILRVFSDRAGYEVEVEAELTKPMLRGEDVHRYDVPEAEFVCIYPYTLTGDKTTIIEEADLQERFPLGYGYLKRYQSELQDIRIRQKTNPRYWYSCHRSRDMRVFQAKRIITPEISLGCNMTVAPGGLYHNTKVYSLVPDSRRLEDLHYWLGLLNSRVLWWFLSNTGYVLRGGYFTFKTNYLNPFPIRSIDFSAIDDGNRHDQMVGMVERMLSLRERLASATTSHDRNIIQRQIDATDRQIDRLVYELYGLTDEEIGVVEGAEREIPSVLKS